ncbi:unnamed protein product [Coccothraustes coccothraustes]
MTLPRVSAGLPRMHAPSRACAIRLRGCRWKGLRAPPVVAEPLRSDRDLPCWRCLPPRFCAVSSAANREGGKSRRQTPLGGRCVKRGAGGAAEAAPLRSRLQRALRERRASAVRREAGTGHL